MAQHHPNIDPDATERIGHRKRPVSHEPVYTTDVAESRDRSIEAELQDTSHYKVYTDGSGLEGNAGAAALIYEGKGDTPLATRHLHLGPMSHHTTYEAEWVGMLLGIWLILTVIPRHLIGIKNVTIYTDNQSVISTARSGAPGPAQYIAERFDSLAEKLRHQGPRITKFRVRWISAHSDVKRNEQVDEEAKNASRGQTSAEEDLPRILQRTLPASKSALIRAAKALERERWVARWANSPRRPRLEALDDEFPCRTFLKTAKQLPRYQAARLTQLRTGHIPLNTYLHKRKLADTDKCEQCQSGRRETVTHFLFECPAYRKQRSIMDKTHKTAKHDLKAILRDTQHTKSLMAYISTTARFDRDSDSTQTRTT